MSSQTMATTSQITHEGLVLNEYLNMRYNKYKRNKTFATGVVINNKFDLVKWTDGFWWQYQGITPYTIQASDVPFSSNEVQGNWKCMGLLEGYAEGDVRNFNVFPDEGVDLTDKLKYVWALRKKLRDATVFPAGVFEYIDLGKITPRRCGWFGVPNMGTIFKCNNIEAGHVALDIDAWPDPVNPNQPFIDGFTLSGIHVEANANASAAISIQGLARSHFDDVTAWGGSPLTGSGIILKASSLNQFDRLMCSKYRNLAGQTVNVPQYGITITTGYRAGAFQGSPSNNLFNNMYMEGVPRGCNMLYGDQNTFLGGSCEANSDYGLSEAQGCRYNSYRGMGNENLNATTGDFIMRGHYSVMDGCYGSQRVVIGAGARGITICRGYYELIEIQTNAVNSCVHDVTVNHWNTGNGGFTDDGIGTRKWSIWDEDASDWVNTSDTRTGIVFTQTPVAGGIRGVWVNTTRLPVTVYIQGTAAITAATLSRDGVGGDTVSLPVTSVQAIRVEPKDALTITWSTGAAPSASYRRHTEN